MTRVVDKDNGLSTPVTVERDSDAILLPWSLVATPEGFRALWTHGGPWLWTFRTVDMAPDGTSDPPRVLARDGFGGVQLSPRPLGGYVKHWISWGRALFVQVLDDETQPASTISHIGLPGVAGWPIVLHPTDGSFVVLVAQEVIHGYILTGVRAQRFDAGGRPVGSWLRLLPPLLGAGGGVAALGADGTIAISTTYRDTRSHTRVLTFTSDGATLWHYNIVHRPSSRAIGGQSVAVDPNGRVLWVWADYTEFPDIHAFRARTFAKTGEPLGPTFALATGASADRPFIHCAVAGWAGEGRSPRARGSRTG